MLIRENVASNNVCIKFYQVGGWGKLFQVLFLPILTFQKKDTGFDARKRIYLTCQRIQEIFSKRILFVGILIDQIYYFVLVNIQSWILLVLLNFYDTTIWQLQNQKIKTTRQKFLQMIWLETITHLIFIILLRFQLCL